jgi:CheY-like chemotaxis protein
VADDETNSRMPDNDHHPGARKGQQPLAGVEAMVIDDDPLNAKLCALLLGQAGAVVRVAHSAEQALEMIAQPPFPRVLLVDLVLPRMSGFTLVARMKERHAAAMSRAVIVAVSFVSSDEARRAAARAGCAALVTKPVDVETLAAVLAGLIQDAA